MSSPTIASLNSVQQTAAPGATSSPGLRPESVGAFSAAAACIYASHFLARWAWRTWEFAVALVLMELSPTSLLLVSVYGLLDNIVRLMLGSLVGQYIDRTDRLKGAINGYGVQNICIASSAAAAAVLVALHQHKPESLTSSLYWFLMVVVVAAGSSSSVGSMAAALSVEREYPKAMCGGDTMTLSKVNSVLRAIDLTCQMVAPVVSGVLMTYAGVLVAVVVQGVYCVAIWLPECVLLRMANSRSTPLREPKAFDPSSAAARRPHPLALLLGLSSWAAYFRQSTLLAGLALALLYFTVLSLGFLMTSYLAWRGMSQATLSLFRAVGAMAGLAATVIFPPVQRCMGLVATGTAGISWQLLCLLLGVVPVLISHVSGWQGAALGGGSSALLYTLLAGLVASRLGLWLFDLAVTQLQQELVPGSELGTVSGVQGSIQSFFEILSFVAGAIVSRPELFHWLMAGSCGVVAAATVLYVVFAVRARGIDAAAFVAEAEEVRLDDEKPGAPGVADLP